MVDIQSLILNVIPYGLPILIFALASRQSSGSTPDWSIAGNVNMTLFALTFVAMSAHVTLAYFFSEESFINVYFNVPIIYSAPLLLFAILWAGTKNSLQNSAEQGILGRIINSLPTLLVIAMVINVVVVSVVEIIRQSGDMLFTSAPWWVSPLLVAFCYVAVISLSLIIRGVYNRIASNR